MDRSNTPSVPPELRVIRFAEAFKRLGLKKSAAFERIKNRAQYPGFPAPLTCAGVRGFLESELNDYISACAAARRDEEPRLPPPAPRQASAGRKRVATRRTRREARAAA